MNRQQICQRHLKEKEYFCIEKSNQSQISFLCQDCINETNFLQKQGQGKVFQFDNLLQQVDKASETLKTKYSDLNQLMKKFEQFKQKIEIQITTDHDFFFELSKGIKDLQHYGNQRDFPEFYQKAILNEEREVQNSFRQQMIDECQQFTAEMNEFINIQQNGFHFVAYTQYSNQNSGRQSGNQIQGTQTKLKLKLKKQEEKKNKLGTNLEFVEQLDIAIEKEQQHRNCDQVVQPQKIQHLSTTQQVEAIQPQQQQQQPGNQLEILQDTLQGQRLIINKNLFKQQIIFREKITNILVINKDVQIVKSDKEVRLCRYLEQREKIEIIPKRMDNTILDIQLVHPQKILIRTKQHHLYFFNLQLSNKEEFNIELKKNKFAFQNGILYRYDNQTQELIKERLGSTQPLMKQQINLPDDMMVVAIKIVGEQLHVGFSNGKVRHYKLSNFDQLQEYEIPKQQKEIFRLFYFEKDYCIGVQKTMLYKKVYRPQIHISDDIVQTKDKILQCSYLIDHENRKIEIQCLQQNNKVFTYKKKGNVVCRNNQLKYTEISCIQACPTFKRFYYGYIGGDLKCVKLKF